MNSNPDGVPASWLRDRTVARTNCFKIERFPEAAVYYRYKNFDPPPKEGHRRQRFEIIEKLQISDAYASLFTPRGAFDGVSSFVIAKRLQLPGQGEREGTFEVSLSPRQKFRVTFMGVGEPVRLGALQNYQSHSASHDQSLHEPINVLQLLINQVPALTYVKKGRSFFTHKDSKTLDGIELMNGFFQAIRPSRDHIMINIDLTFGAFHAPQKLIDAALAALRSKGFSRASPSDLARRPQDRDYRDTYTYLKQYFKKLNVKLLCTKSKKPSHKIYDLVPNAGRYVFDAQDEQGIVYQQTVADYFRQTYSYHLRYPDSFGVCLTPKNAQRPMIVPFELCELLPGQVFNGQLSSRQQSDMITFATKTPKQREDAILGSIASRGVPVFDHRVSDYLGGMTVARQMSQLSGYMIPTPQIIFGGNTNPENSSVWNIQRKTVHKPATNRLSRKQWGVFNFDRQCQKPAVDGFIRVLAGCYRGRGINNIEFENYQYTQADPTQAARRIREAAQEAMSQGGRLIMAIVILPQEAADVKFAVKREADLQKETGLIAFCVRSGKVLQNNSRDDNQYCNNMILKLNSRLGGVNYKVDFPQIVRSPYLRGWPPNRIPVFLIAGIDVNHPAPGVRHKPSVAAITFSTNDTATQYKARLVLQAPRTEVLDRHSLRRAFRSIIEEFLGSMNKINRETGQLVHPEGTLFCLAQLIVFRDGVSESQYQAVKEHEIPAVQEAISAVRSTEAGSKLTHPRGVKLTYVVVTKRHHVLNFPTDQRFVDQKAKGNFIPGFTTHRSLAVPGLDEYYLQSHAAIKGTARPAHYIILLNEVFLDDERGLGSGFSQIEDLAFRLCHVYSKATRSVSIPAPVYYAHLACTRANYHFNPQKLDEADEQMSQSAQGGGTFDVLEFWRQPGAFDQVTSSIVANSMYFT